MGPSNRIMAVQTPVIPLVAELIQANPGTISLGQGVVGYGPPPQAFETIQRFTADPANHRYQHVQGIAPLIEAIGAKLARDNAIDLEGRDIVVTAGSNMGFLNAVLAIADPQDEIVLLGPYYFNQEMAVSIAGCRPVIVATDEAYQPDTERITNAITDRTRAVVTISPNNPTGAVYSRSSLQTVNELCRERGIYHISDEAYEYFTYEDATHYSPAAFAGSRDHTISLFSLSKAFGFASWRIGYMLIPSALGGAIKKIQDTNVICPPVISQFAALGALEAGYDYCRPHLQRLGEIRALVVDALDSLSNLVHTPRAQGAFYFLVEVMCDLSSLALVEHLIREHKVAVIPGSTFGVQHRCCLRIAYGALEKETVTDGMGRLISGLRQLAAD